MVCNRCVAAVSKLLTDIGLAPVNIDLGEVKLLQNKLPKEQKEQLKAALSASGFELIDDKRSKQIEQIKNVVVEMVHYSEPISIKHSTYIAEKLNQDYTYLSKLFSETEGITIEHYIIKQKIERVKELLVYDELSLSEIAYQLGYSSVAHLSSQFKKTTGLTPTFYKNKGVKRTPIDKVK